MIRSSALFAALAVTLAAAQQYSTSPANQTAIELIQAQWNNAGLNTPIQSGQSLNQPLNAQALLEIVQNGQSIVTGAPYPAGDLGVMPRRECLATLSSCPC